MTSNDNVLQGFEWDYEGTVGFTRGQGYKGVGISRTMFLRPKQIADIPEQLFALKLSQSTNQQKTGKPVFKYLSYKLTEDQKPSDLAPSEVGLDTPLDQVKSIVMNKLANLPGASVSLNIGLKGTFTNIACADKTYTLYDENAAELKTDDPNTTGNAPYYIKADAIVHVKLKGAMSKQGNAYIQSELSTTSTGNEIFVMPQRGEIWNGNGATPAATPAAGGASPESVW